MYNNTDSDFWKEKLVLIQRQCSRVGEPISDLSIPVQSISSLKEKFPNLSITSDVTSSSVTCEILVNAFFKIRLFIQRQTKLSFFTKSKTGFEKVADGKLLNNPFPLVEHFLTHFNEYNEELSSLKEKNLHNSKFFKVASEFINANLIKKFEKNENISWNIEQKDDYFILYIKDENKTLNIRVNPYSLTEDLENIAL